MSTNIYWPLHAGFLSSLLSDPEDGGDIFPLNTGSLSMDYKVLYPGKQNSSGTQWLIIMLTISWSRESNPDSHILLLLHPF
jgi:hypothetical protein